MYFKTLDSFTVEKLKDGDYKVVYYGNLKPEVGEDKAYWSQNYKTLYDAIKDLFDGWDVYDSTEIIAPLIMGEDALEVAFDDKKDIIEYLSEEGRFTLHDNGYVSENIKIVVKNVDYNDDGSYLVGSVMVDGVNYPFDYNIVTQDTDIHHYSNPSWLDGSCYEKPLPNVVVRNFEEVDSAIYISIQGFFEKHIHEPTAEEIEEALADGWTKEEVNRGYIICCDGDGAEFIARLDCLGKFDGDWIAAEQAEKDGYVIMRDEVRDYPYLDTPENRKILNGLKNILADAKERSANTGIKESGKGDFIKE